MKTIQNKYFYLLLYLIAGVVFLLLLPEGDGDASGVAKSLSEKVSGDEATAKTDIVKFLINQIGQNSKGYLNNVWTTLATVMMAIGLTLGSNRLQDILKHNSNAVIIFQIAIFLIFVAHAGSYWYYYYQSNQLLDLLEPLVVDIRYFEGFSIQRSQVIINLAFDAIIFLLLVFIVNRLSGLEEGEQ